MNLRQSYEQLVADKLRKLPSPDVNASWQQMKRLLDDEDTKTGGRPPSNGGGGWWRMGIIAVVLLGGLWLYIEKPAATSTVTAKNNTMVVTPDTKNAETKTSTAEKTITSDNNQTATIDKNTTLSGTGAHTTSGSNPKSTAASAALPSTSNTANKTAAGNTTAAGNNRNDNHKNIPGLINKAADNHLNNPDKNNIDNVHAGVGITSSNGVTKNTYTAPRQKRKTPAAIGDKDYNDAFASPAVNEKMIAGNTTTGRPYLSVNEPAYTAGKTWFEQVTDFTIPGKMPSSNTSLALNDSIETYRNTTGLLNNESKKGVAKAQRDKTLEDMSKKEKRSFHLNLSDVFKPFSLNMDAEPRWAAGIALNSGITVNAQNRYKYNMNGKSGILSDYIPSLYLQFHLNDYVYAQTELNFISPQYTPQLLIYQQNADLTAQGLPGSMQQKSISIQKLYYFSLPVTLHYSPINNFYFSAGLQFSSFQSGLVSIQEKQYTTLAGPDHPGSMTNTVVKFKDDSIAAKLSPNEWRWQAGADYYWNRFTVGIRYNRAFKNLLNVNLSGSLPANPLRNESLLFSIRYNLFESRKKN